MAGVAGSSMSVGSGGSTAGAPPPWLLPPADPNLLVPELWPASTGKPDRGELVVAGVPVSRIAEEFGTPTYVLDEDDFRARARAFREGFAGADVYYAGKAFLCVAVARWVVEEGLNLDVCSGGELATALRAGVDPARIGFHGNNKSVAELERAVAAGIGRIVVDSLVEIARLERVAAAGGVTQPVLVRVTPGVEAHTHAYIATAHEDQKFGFPIAGGEALAAMRLVESSEHLELRGLHCHIGSQIFDSAGFDLAARRVLSLYGQAVREGMTLGELDLGGGFGIAYSTQDHPAPAAALADRMRATVTDECRTQGLPVPRLSVEPGRAIAGPSTFTLYEVGTVKTVRLDGGAHRLYVAVDGGMSDNIRTALYGADFSCTLASRWSTAGPVLARVVGKHCESGDIVVRDEFLPSDVAPGDLVAVPGTGAYCRSLANTYNHVPRPPVVAVRDGQTSLLLRRETEDDLLALDVS